MEADIVRDSLEYFPETGEFRWKISGRGQTKRKGCVAGSPHSNGYVRIKVGGVTYFAHRLAWLLNYGTPPMNEIDHINGNRADNRIENLREATTQQNRWNTHGFPSRRKHSKFKGVSRDARSEKSKWFAQISIAGKSVCIGYFDTEEEASSAYEAAAKQCRGEFAKW